MEQGLNRRNAVAVRVRRWVAAVALIGAAPMLGACVGAVCEHGLDADGDGVCDGTAVDWSREARLEPGSNRANIYRLDEEAWAAARSAGLEVALQWPVEVSGTWLPHDALRTVLYVGNRFSDDWLLNTELEFEHGTTDASSGTTDGEGSVSVEFAYLEHLVNENHAVRGGLLLVPMGLVNELHEPTVFLGARRPEVERLILPTTWRENGLGEVDAEQLRRHLASVLEARGA